MSTLKMMPRLWAGVRFGLGGMPSCSPKFRRVAIPSSTSNYISSAANLPSQRTFASMASTYNRTHLASSRIVPTYGVVRQFRSSARVEMPAPVLFVIAGALCKTSGVLVFVSEASRILFTLLPLSTVWKIKMGRRLQALNALTPIATISTPVLDFYDHHFKDEQPVHPDKRMQRQAWEAMGVNCHSLRGKTRKEKFHEVTVLMSKINTGLPPTYTEIDAKPMQGMKRMWNEIFMLPPLPASAVGPLEAFTMEQRQELYTWRRYRFQQMLFQRKLKALQRMMMVVLFLPVVAMLLGVVLSLEKAPYTGRWRSILLSPEEEDAISAKLVGAGWYKTVITQLTTPEQPAPAIVPQSDWRWTWVNSILRSLETGMVSECDRNKRAGISPEAAKEVDEERHAIFKYASGLVPPPPDMPLQPRPRPASLLREAVTNSTEGMGREHLEFGPPYSLLLMQNDERNALSFGFGKDGAGGVVVFTGILDEILSSRPETEELVDPADRTVPTTPATISPISFLSSFFGVSSSNPAPISAQPQPTEAQNLQLASVLAHELAHLILSHHLEALSATQVLVPNAANLAGDLVRTIIFPVTAMFGPHVHDVIAKWTKFSIDETKAFSDVAFSRTQEREADVVALRILAYAGYDPQDCVRFWNQTPTPACMPDHSDNGTEADKEKSGGDRFLWGYLRGETHDSDEQRFEALKGELQRWRSTPTLHTS